MKKRYLALVLTLCMLLTMCVACGKDSVTSDPDSSTPQGSNTTTTGEDTTTTTTEDGTTTMDTDTTTKDNDSSSTTTKKPTSTTKVKDTTTTTQPVGKAKTLYVKDFGAKGDGVTDDGASILAAIAELRGCPKGSTLVFEKNKTYYYKNSGISHLFYLNENEGLTIKGDNTTIKLGGTDINYMDIRNCKDITIEGFNLDYGDHKPAFAAEALQINASQGWAIVKADRDIKLDTGDVTYPLHTDWFGVIPHETSRYHMYIQKYEMLDASQRKLKVYFDTSNSVTMSRLKNNQAMINADGFVLPDPYIGNKRGKTEAGFSIHRVDTFTMRNINIYSVARHGFVTYHNTGEILFENVNFVRAPYDQGLKYTSWADTYHVLYNRVPYKWVNCKNEWNYDDVFNISAATLFVDKVYSSKEILLRDHSGDFAEDDLLPGDELQIIDYSTGKWVVRTKIKSIVGYTDGKIRVKLEDAMASTTNFDKWYAWDESHCAPGSQFINCEFEGTFRIRTQLSMINCTIHNRRAWIGLEAMNVEGPVGRDILFKNCKFINENNWEITANNSTKDGYHLENIVFEGCTGMNIGTVEIGLGDEVIIR